MFQVQGVVFLSNPHCVQLVTRCGLQSKSWPPLRNRARSFQNQKMIQINQNFGSRVFTEIEPWYQMAEVYDARAGMRFPSNVTFRSRKSFLWMYVEQRNWEGTWMFCGDRLEKISGALRQWEDLDLRGRRVHRISGN